MNMVPIHLVLIIPYFTIFVHIRLAAAASPMPDCMQRKETKFMLLQVWQYCRIMPVFKCRSGEMVYALDSKSGVARHVGSSPTSGTIQGSDSMPYPGMAD